MPKLTNVRVTTMSDDMAFVIEHNTTGQTLLRQVAKAIGLQEIWFFGLQYVDNKGYTAWLKLNKKVLSQDVRKEATLQFKFRALFFPEEASEELIQDITRKLFFLQVSEAIVNDEIYCPSETAVLLASYQCQARYGDYDVHTHKLGFLSNDRLLPQRVYDQHKLTKERWEEQITDWYKEHRGMMKEDAMLEYLKIAQDLDMYGVNYFDIKNKRGSELKLGVDALGLSVYGKEDKLTPKIGFPWGEIRTVSFNNKKFVIKPVDKKAPNFVFFAPRSRINERILTLCMGNNELYIRRRKPETEEMQSMREHAQEERRGKQQERAKMQKKRDFEKQTEDYNRVKRDLEAQKAHTDALQRQWEASHHMEREEQERLDRELQQARSYANQYSEQLSSKQTVIEQLRREVERTRQSAEEGERSRQEAEERRFQLETEAREATQRAETEARLRREAEASAAEHLEQLAAAAAAAAWASSEERRFQLETEAREATQRAETEARLRREAEASVAEHLEQLAAAAAAAAWASASLHVRENDQEENEETNAEISQEFEDCSNLPRPEEDRLTAAEKNKRLQEQLEKLKRELAKTKEEQALTSFDRFHMENVRQGRDKYKTLKQIRQGNTKRRVDEFEAL